MNLTTNNSTLILKNCHTFYLFAFSFLEKLENKQTNKLILCHTGQWWRKLGIVQALLTPPSEGEETF